VHVGNVADVSALYPVSIFRVEICRMAEHSCICSLHELFGIRTCIYTTLFDLEDGSRIYIRNVGSGPIQTPKSRFIIENGKMIDDSSIGEVLDENGLLIVNYTDACFMELRKIRKITLRIAGVPTKIRTEYFRRTSVGRYH
jgi:hypothetical protein